jgi:hypothetical protein
MKFKKALFVYSILLVGLLSLYAYQNSHNLLVQIVALCLSILSVLIPAAESLSNWYDELF